MREDPRHPGKGQVHCFVVHGNLTSYTWGWCTIYLTYSRLQLIAGSVLFMRLWCAIMYPAVSSTPHSGHGICLCILTWYESPTPVYFSTMASSDIPTRNDLGWNVIVHGFEMLATRSYLLKSPTRRFIVCCSQSDPHEPTMPSL